MSPKSTNIGASRVIIDTQLFLVLVIGRISSHAISKHKRLEGYDASDYAILVQYARKFDKVVLTPHIYTEANNLGVQLGKSIKVSDFYRSLCDFSQVCEELFKPFQIVNQDICLAKLGITDTVIARLASEGIRVLTHDEALFNHLISKSYQCDYYEDVVKRIKR